MPGEVDAPVPGPGEVGVRIRAIGVNFADTERRRGVYAVPKLPWIPGHEAAGMVEALGDGVDRALLGARVAYWTPRSSGSYAAYATAPARELFRFASEIAFERMAALPLQGLTAWGVVHLAARVRAGQVGVAAYGLDVELDPDACADARRALAAAVSGGSLALTVAPPMPLSAAADAHRAIEARQTIGKLVLDPDR